MTNSGHILKRFDDRYETSDGNTGIVYLYKSICEVCNSIFYVRDYSYKEIYILKDFEYKLSKLTCNEILIKKLLE